MPRKRRRFVASRAWIQRHASRAILRDTQYLARFRRPAHATTNQFGLGKINLYIH
jgi:hypothetical protein